MTSYGAHPVSASLIAAVGIKAIGPSSGFGSLSRTTMSMSLSRIVTPDGPEMRILMFSSGSSSVSPSRVTGNVAICWPGAQDSRNCGIGA